MPGVDFRMSLGLQQGKRKQTRAGGSWSKGDWEAGEESLAHSSADDWTCWLHLSLGVVPRTYSHFEGFRKMSDLF